MTDELEQRVAEAYRTRWGRSPDRVTFVPGRINLIGDHTDYSLLPVLPIAIQYGIAFAIGSGPRAGVVLDSLDEPGELEVGVGADVDPVGGPSWHRYARAALRDHIAVRGARGVVFAGDLPRSGGLSSSSALVVGLLAVLGGADAAPERGDRLVEAAVRAERSAAIEGGAMDQTVIVFAQEGAALRIDFDPPQRRVVPVPGGLAWIAADSGERAPKGGSAKDAYNSRVVACRCAAALLARDLGEERPRPLVLGRLGAVARDAIEALPITSSAGRVASSARVPVGELVDLASAPFPADRELPIRAVASHVFAEAARVDEAEHALRAGDFARLGEILDASHRSLQRFGSSTRALDRLTSAMNDAGALGARVTGAGFGGYAVAACRPEDSARVVAAARQATGSVAFVARPSAGFRSRASGSLRPPVDPVS